MDVEGEMTEMKTSCGAAIIRVHLDFRNRSSDIGICGTNQKVIAPITSLNNSIRIRLVEVGSSAFGLIDQLVYSASSPHQKR